MGDPSIRIGLLWHSLTSDNLGVGALTVAHMDIARAAAAAVGLTPTFRVLGWAEPRTPYNSADDVILDSFRLGDFAKPVGGFLAKARACDVILDIGAGDSFSDIYGPARILKMFAAQNLVRIAGRPHVISPQTIGPFANAMIATMAAGILRNAALVAVRDSASAECARQIGYDGVIVEACDVALRLPFEPAPKASDGVVRVGVNVSGLLFNGGYTGDNMFGLKSDYGMLIREVIKLFRVQPWCEVHLVGHVLSKDNAVEDDWRAARVLSGEYPGVVLAPRFRSPVEAKSYISGLDFFTGARMHACLAAFSSGVPVVPMAYSRKFGGLFGGLGYNRVADCTKDDLETVLAHIKTGFTERERLKAEAAKALSTGLHRLDGYERGLQRLFTDVAQRLRCAA